MSHTASAVTDQVPEMVERIERALAERFSPAIDFRAPYAKIMLREAARAAIEAMREPTGAMKDAGAATYGVHELHIGPLPQSTIDGQPSKAWRAMIAAALR